MNFHEAVRTCFKKYTAFDGCASRSEFWWWTLFVFLAQTLLGLISETVMGIFGLATLLPSITVTARRLHDIDRSGWWQLLIFLPILGWFVLLYWYCQPEKRPTRYEEQSALTPVGHFPGI
ncbi:MAG: DUF805 domain-containing protein [Pseudomonadota bacterium]